jgi:tetratricopeptide (TPR) repeat protein
VQHGQYLQVHNAMGYCYQNSEKSPDAIKQFQQATKLQPGYVTAWNNLGDALEKQGRWKDAQPAYEAAFELDPENETARQAVDRLRNKAARMSVNL